MSALDDVTWMLDTWFGTMEPADETPHHAAVRYATAVYEEGRSAGQHETQEPLKRELVLTLRALAHCREGHRRRSAIERDGAILDRTFKRQYETAQRQAALNLDRALRAERLAATMAQRALAAEIELDRIKREAAR